MRFDPAGRVREQLRDCIRTAEDDTADSKARDKAAKQIPSLQARLQGLVGDRWWSNPERREEAA